MKKGEQRKEAEKRLGKEAGIKATPEDVVRIRKKAYKLSS